MRLLAYQNVPNCLGRLASVYDDRFAESEKNGGVADWRGPKAEIDDDSPANTVMKKISA